jgi:hypothetical protein
MKKWVLTQTVAKVLALRDPDEPQWTVSWAYATRRVDSLEAARLILVNAVERQPNVAIFHYNLACYECQLGMLHKAQERLKHTFELGPPVSSHSFGRRRLGPVVEFAVRLLNFPTLSAAIYTRKSAGD